MHIPLATGKMRKLQVQILTRDGRKSIYETDRSRNVAELKKRIGRTMNVPMAFSRLTYKGRLLANDCILEDEGVKRMSTLELFWQPLVLTPKQYREKELELDKLDQKQRHVSRIAENYEQTVKKGGHERTPSGLRRTRDRLRVKRSLSVDDMKLSSNSFARLAEPKIEESVPEEELKSSSSTEELDFLAAYWCCTKSTTKKTRKSVDANGHNYVDIPVDADAVADAKGNANANANANNNAGALKLDAGKELKMKASGIATGIGIGNDDDFDDLMAQRSLNNNNPQPFRSGLRLAAGRMSRSMLTNTRKNPKNSKK
ncbi:uncharacterized protein LOC108655878 [Drosophila navojoa]|uniref:uncharacterized protein LOC108655878 n=1 Tax=Drosophila navojoa TaxID=7232 RepID=UPI0011BDE73C|nr:uncharacterized protein LOC108655878 [Drosophila navojoa]